MLTMLVFGLGTLPAMLATGTARGLTSPATRARLARLAGALVVAFGIMTLLRGFGTGHLHH
jgi:sulfite exporter TauE/SafE